MGSCHHKEKLSTSPDPRIIRTIERWEKELSYDTLIVWGDRTAEQQLALFAQGRTVPGNNITPSKPMGDVVTNAGNPQVAPHCHLGQAIDAVPLTSGRIAWAKEDPLFSLYMKRQAEMARIAKEEGLEWGGDWAWKDWDHLQTPEWKEAPLAHEEAGAKPSA